MKHMCVCIYTNIYVFMYVVRQIMNALNVSSSCWNNSVNLPNCKFKQYFHYIMYSFQHLSFFLDCLFYWHVNSKIP